MIKIIKEEKTMPIDETKEENAQQKNICKFLKRNQKWIKFELKFDLERFWN